MDAAQFAIAKEISTFWWFVVVLVSGVSFKLALYIWNKHNKEIASINTKLTQQGEEMKQGFDRLHDKIVHVEKTSTPLATYEQNRQEMRAGQVQIFTQLNNLSNALARIEGKLEAQKDK
jgi:hypothetical protein